MEQVACGPPAVEQRRRGALRAQCLGQRRKRRQADAAGHHPGLRGRRADGERPPERAEALQARARLEGVERAGNEPDALVEEREAGHAILIAAQDFEDGERPAQQRRAGAVLPDHYELTGLRGGRDGGRREPDHVVSVGQPIVRQNERIDIRQHGAQYNNCRAPD